MSAPPARMSWVQRLLDGALKTYQVTLSPLLGQRCRFHPSCSEYARESIQVHGSIRGLWLAVKRLARCHPLSRGGLDPVPPEKRIHNSSNKGKP